MLPEPSTAFWPPMCTVLVGPSTTTTLVKAGFLCRPSGSKMDRPLGGSLPLGMDHRAVGLGLVAVAFSVFVFRHR